MRILVLALLVMGCGPQVTVNGKTISNPPEHVMTALDKYGLNEYQHRTVLREYTSVDPARTEWCAAFANAVLAESGIPGSESISDVPLMARSFLDWGNAVDTPQAGDIVVFPRGRAGWKGHVGFYVGSEFKEDKEYYRILGGNQSNSVNIELYPAHKALGIRRWEL
jgi:uncharacterized protein (TIGR02594 family)